MPASIFYIGLVMWTLAVYWQPLMTMFLAERGYRYVTESVSFAPYWELFVNGWIISLMLLNGSIVWWWSENVASSLYSTVLILILIQIVLIKFWLPLFLTTSYRISMFLLGLIILLLSLTIIILLIISLAWGPFSLYVAATTWMLYVLILNAAYISAGSITRRELKLRTSMHM